MSGGVLVSRCPHCGEPPGMPALGLIAPEAGPWTCDECGETFDSPALIPEQTINEDD